MKRLVTLLVVLCLALPLFAGQNEADDSGAEGTTITMWTFLNPEGATSGRNLALSNIISNYEADNPNISIQVEPQQWDLMTSKFLAAHEAGNAPDIIWVISYEIGNAVRLGALEPFENLFLDDWTDAEIADIADSFWDWGAEPDRHYQITFSRNYFGLMYRQDLMDEYNIATPFQSWDDLIAAAQTLTGEDEEIGIQRYGLGQAFGTGKVDPPVFTYMALDRQGDLFTEDGRAMFATPAVEESLEMMIDMVTEYGITPDTAVSYDQEQVFQDFIAGRYAMIVGAGVRVPSLRGQASNFPGDSIRLGFYPDASGDGSPSPGGISGWAVGVWSGSPVKEEAGQFLEYMASPEADELWVLEGGQVPMRASTIESLSDFFSQPENEYLKIMAEGFAEHSWATPAEFPISGLAGRPEPRCGRCAGQWNERQ
jgi:multiple sugar transport system substrate-binding protein